MTRLHPRRGISGRRRGWCGTRIRAKPRYSGGTWVAIDGDVPVESADFHGYESFAGGFGAGSGYHLAVRCCTAAPASEPGIADCQPAAS